jgi:hypothetical protein
MATGGAIEKEGEVYHRGCVQHQQLIKVHGKYAEAERAK